MGWTIILMGSSGASQLVNWVGRRLPTSRFLQLTPMAKISQWFNIPIIHFRAPQVDRAVVRGSQELERSLFATMSPALDVLSPWTNAILRQQKTKLTTVNHWMQFLYGPGAAYRGRETYRRRVVGAAMRASGFGTPASAAVTLATPVAFALMWHWWNTPGKEQAPPVIDPPPPRPKPRRHGVQIGKVPKPRDRRTLRDLIVYALRNMGMSSSGVNDLLDGKTIYGADADIYRRICSFIFIRCLSCNSMSVIEHDELMNAVIYLDESDLLVSYCHHCQGFCVADVTTLDSDRELVHLSSQARS